MTTVALCSPHGGLVRSEWTRSLLTMQNASEKLKFVHIEVDSMIVGKARNMAVESALANKCEVIWFIDDDVIIPPNAGILVDQALSLGVVSGLYFSRRFPFAPQMYEDAGPWGQPGMYYPMFEWNKGLIKVDAIGAGCMVIAAPVFERLTEEIGPIFRETAKEVSVPWVANMVEKMSPWFEFLDRKGEDMYFCERLHEIGQDVYVNTEIICAHMSDLPITEEQFRQLKDAGMIQRTVVQPAVPEPTVEEGK